jgi:hypothetical protein
MTQQRTNKGAIAATFRAERVRARLDLVNLLCRKGADREGISAVTNVQYEALYGVDATALYDEYGGKKGDRDTLPPQVQEDVWVAEVINARLLRGYVLRCRLGDRAAANGELCQVLEQSTRLVRQLLYPPRSRRAAP